MSVAIPQYLGDTPLDLPYSPTRYVLCILCFSPTKWATRFIPQCGPPQAKQAKALINPDPKKRSTGSGLGNIILMVVEANITNTAGYWFSLC